MPIMQQAYVCSLDPGLAIDTPRLVLAETPTFTAQQHMNASIAVANAGLANLLDPLLEGSLSGATRLVVVGGRIDQEHTAGSSDRHIPVAAHFINELALADRLQSFRRRAY